jgi:hypothetical protein
MKDKNLFLSIKMEIFNLCNKIYIFEALKN